MSNVRYKGVNGMLNGVHFRDLCGWVPDDNRIADMRARHGRLLTVAPHLLDTPRQDVYLWKPLLQVRPQWQRGAQGIGDCISWGWELAMTHLMAIIHAKGQGRFIAEAATEPCYGGCRVEALGKKRGGRQDGAFGAAAATWGLKWGVILRVDMSKETGNREHDLRTYSADKAKDWGDFGCGGRNDNGMLDGAARLMPVQHVVGVDEIDELAAAISNLYTVTIASNVGFGDMVRDRSGIVRARGTWPHQMEIAGVRWRGGEPQFRIFQSWGPKSCSGPDPGIDDPAISGCSWWAVAEDVARILRTGDCWIMGDIKGLPKQDLDLVKPANKWYRPDITPIHSLAV